MNTKMLLLGLFAGFLTACSSPQIKITAVPEKITSPVFIGNPENPLWKLKIHNPTEHELTVKSICLSTEGTTDINDIASIKAYFTGNSPHFSSSVLFGNTVTTPRNVKFQALQTLQPGDNYFWISPVLKQNAGIKNYLHLTFQSIELVNCETQIADSNSYTPAPIGVAIRKPMDDSSKCYRIPGLVRTPKGTLIAVYDIRWHGPVDLQEDVDVGISRSLDNGQTWLPMQKVIDQGEWGNKPQKENGVGDPAILVDPETGRIWITALWFHGNPGKRAWWASHPGLKPEETGQLLLVYSDDEGASWSAPINITTQVKKPEWYLCFNGPGMGITTKAGDLVFAAQFKDKNQIPHSTILYSRDKGKTWQMGTGARAETTEAQVVELTDGSLMLNMRDNRGGSRAVAITRDFGQHWETHSSSRQALPESVCQASLIRFITRKGKPALAFFNPATTEGRHHSTLKLSFDEGQSWPFQYHQLVYEPESFGYSCLAQINDTTLGVVYEGAGEIYFQQIPLPDSLK